MINLLKMRILKRKIDKLKIEALWNELYIINFII